MSEIPKVAKTSADIPNENLEKLRSIFPNFVKDGQIDFDALQAFLKNDGILSGEEKYGLSWAGKTNAFRAIRTPATGTLMPQPEESKNWDTTQNIFIEGDNLEVLKLLQKHYRGEIKMIYIDPPYNTGKDFVYKDNFTKGVADYYEQTGQTKDGIRMTANTEKNGRYHSDWLTMMYPRLFLAHNLLREDGVIFVSIDDNEVANLRMIMDEIFGEENFVACLIWEQGKKSVANFIGVNHEYILIFAKNIGKLKEDGLWKQKKEGLESIYSEYEKLKSLYGDDYKLIEEGMRSFYNNLHNDDPAKLSKHYQKIDSRGVYFPDNVSQGNGNGTVYEILHPITGKPCKLPSGGYRYSPDTLEKFIKEGRIHYGTNETSVICYKRYLSETEGEVPPSVFYRDGRGATKIVSDLVGGEFFDFPKDHRELKRLFSFTTKGDDLILDFFAGSGTTAHAVMELNAENEGSRRFICVQLPEATDEESEAYKAGYKKISDITRERIRRAGARHSSQVRNEREVESIPAIDTGFKSFTLSSSNYRQWNTLTDSDDAEVLKSQMKLFAEKPLKDDGEENSIVYEILIKEGFNLNAKVEQAETKNKKKIFIVDDTSRRLFISFAESFSGEEVTELGLGDADTFVCFDSALDDTTKVNLVRNFNIKVI